GSLAFGDVLVGDSAINVYTIKNKGNTNLQIQMVVIQEDDATDFYYTGLPDTPFNIGENDSIVFNIVFKPGSSGDKTSKLKIFTNDLDLTRILTGTTPSFTIEGEVVTPEGDLVNEGTIFVYTFENEESPAELRWKPLEGATVYSFITVPQNTVTLWFKPDSSHYPGYLTTYLGNTAFFNEADVFVLNKDTAGLQITLIPAPPPPSGNSEISGVFVEEDGNKSGNMVTYGKYLGDGTPISEASVFLIDNSGNIFDTDNTNSSGEFIFEKIPVGKYKFAADYLGFSMDDSNDSLVIGQENQKYKIAAIASNKLITIEVENVTAISSLNESSRIYIYPNPANDQIILQFEETFNSGPYTLKINSISGHLVKSSKIEAKGYGEEIIVPINDLPPGLYVITITGNTSIFKATFIKVE
ncbi:MAG: choice-of-anchor D domain-containing protein, partial [Bacteroidales bacterium]|nr:choice-of-anchor D domain-containing protein [Bacteroidales bacterium]